MFKFWMPNWSTGVLTLLLLHDDAGDAGAGGDSGAEDDPAPDPGEHPEFEIPGGVGGTDPDDADRAADRRPAAGDPAARRAQESVEQIPKHRLDEVITARDQIAARLSTTEAELAKFKKLIGASLGIVDPDAPGAAKPLTEREKQIQARLFQLIPGIDKVLALADKADILADVATQMPDFSKQNEQYWGRVARQMYDALESKLAPMFLGKGKTVTDLSAATRSRYRNDFFRWLQDKPERGERYEALDLSIVDEFCTELEADFAPMRRQYGAGAIERARSTARLPVAGGSGTPSRTPKPKPEPMDEDAAADAAWKNLQERLQEA